MNDDYIIEKHLNRSLSTITFNDTLHIKKARRNHKKGIGDGAEITRLVEFSIGYQQTLTEPGQTPESNADSSTEERSIDSSKIVRV